MTKEYFIVWNAAKSEGFITDDEADAKSAKTGKSNYTLGYPSQSTAGAAFHETYKDDKLSIQKVTL